MGLFDPFTPDQPPDNWDDPNDKRWLEDDFFWDRDEDGNVEPWWKSWMGGA